MTKRFFVFLLVCALVLLPTIVSADDTVLSGADASVPPVAAPGSLPGAVFRDCPVCGEFRRSNAPGWFEAGERFRSLRHGG